MTAEDNCSLQAQGFVQGSCLVKTETEPERACQVTLKRQQNSWARLITSIHLSRPENYLSIYQSGCNLSCRKCHSWHFSKIKEGKFYTPQEILKEAISYEKFVTLVEPREKATAWHAFDTCKCCGSCVLNHKKSAMCPGKIEAKAILYSPQGLGPARNIVAFTGGDLTCRPDFYCACSYLIKKHTKLLFLLETNGFGLTLRNLDRLHDAGVDSFWLDLKAFTEKKHIWLTGSTNDNILKLPAEMIKRNFVLEVLSLYIPDLVEVDELEKIALILHGVDPSIPFTILAFFPEYKMKKFRNPTVQEMVETYHKVKAIGLKNIRLGNLGVFIRTGQDLEYLKNNVDQHAF
ncbi:radical SAM protein [candidate division CSSED10-310 bacterium]|uniref:Radical SAM protein n=1 Tax=candidate division CSSED10-310 bacterium TaxID=2855610 RepID=A0ABV6YXA1_UNCC1